MFRAVKRAGFRPSTALIVTLLVLALAAVEVWALTLPVLAEWPVGLPAGWNARDSSILFDLILVLPLFVLLLAWVWSTPRLTTTGPRIPRWLRPWIKPRRLLYLLIPYAIAQLSALELGLGAILAGVAGLAIIGEVAAFGLLAVKLTQLTRATHRARIEGYSFSTSLTTAMERTFGALPIAPVMRLAVFEVTQLFNLTAGWFTRGQRDGVTTFTYHRRRDETLFIGLSIFVVIEAVPIHVVVHHYSAWGAWLATALHVYTLLWTLGDLASVRQRPHRLAGTKLWLSQGLWQEAVVDLGNVRAVVDARGLVEDERAKPAEEDDSVMSFGSRRDVTLELKEPVAVYGLTFGRVGVATIQLALDDPDAFLAALTRG
ncbi:MAG: hypothetical protein WDA03_09555 [Trueperaceae bacterium]